MKEDILKVVQNLANQDGATNTILSKILLKKTRNILLVQGGHRQNRPNAADLQMLESQNKCDAGKLNK